MPSCRGKFKLFQGIQWINSIEVTLFASSLLLLPPPCPRDGQRRASVHSFKICQNCLHIKAVSMRSYEVWRVQALTSAAVTLWVGVTDCYMPPLMIMVTSGKVESIFVSKYLVSRTVDIWRCRNVTSAHHSAGRPVSPAGGDRRSGVAAVRHSAFKWRAGPAHLEVDRPLLRWCHLWAALGPVSVVKTIQVNNFTR